MANSSSDIGTYDILVEHKLSWMNVLISGTTEKRAKRRAQLMLARELRIGWCRIRVTRCTRIE